MPAPCLKVELDGTEVLPKKNAPLKWGEDVLDNDVRDSIRASHAEQDGDSDEDDDEDEQELAQIDSDDDFEEGEEAIPQDVMMKHITTLTQYGYADSHKLSRLSLQEWDDLARNVGIDDAHEHSVMLAIGIKKRKKIRKYKKRASTTKMPSNWKDPEEEDEDEEAAATDKEEANEEEVTLEDELMRMALQRRASMDEGLSPRSTDSDGDGSFPSTGSGDIQVGSYSPMIQSQPEAGEHDRGPEEDDREGGGLSLAERIASRKKGSFGEVGGSASGAGDGASTLAERIAARKAADDHTGDHDDSSSHLHHQITQRKAQDESRGRQDLSVKAVAASSSSVDLTAPGDGDSKQEILKKRIASRKDKTPTNKSSSSSSAAKSAGHAPSSAPHAPPPGWSRQRQDSLNSNNSSPRPTRGCGSASSQAAARTKARSPRMLGMMGRSASGGNKASNPTPPRGRAPPSTQVPQPRKPQSPPKKQQSPPKQPPSKMTLAERREHEHEAKQRQLNDDNSGDDDDDSLSLSSHTSGAEYEATLGDSSGGGGGARRSEVQGKTTRKRVPTPGRTGWAKKGGITSGVRSASPFRASSNGRERGSTR